MAVFASDEFIESLSDDWATAVVQLYEQYQSIRGGSQATELAVDAYWFVRETMDRVWGGSSMGVAVPQLDPDSRESHINAIDRLFQQMKAQADIELKARRSRAFEEQGRARYAGKLGAFVIASLDDATLKHIQSLVNEIRTMLTTSRLPAPYKDRLLRKLEGLQGEMHKHVSDLDRFWGFIGEFGRAAGKLGEDVKPMTDRVNELLRTVCEATGFVQLNLPGRAQAQLLDRDTADTKR